MANALLMSPYPVAFAGGAPATVGVGSNLLNDFSGLLYLRSLSANEAMELRFDLGSVLPMDTWCFLGLGPRTSSQVNYQVVIRGANPDGPIVYDSTSLPAYFGGDDGLPGKLVHKSPTVVSGRYITVFIGTNQNYAFQAWRFLVGLAIQPQENLDAPLDIGVDDRSMRRYTRAGGRVIDPTVIVSTAQGAWSMLDGEEYQKFHNLLRSGGATKPALLVLDPDPSSTEYYAGQRGVIYGDLEKTAKLVVDEAGNYSFSFAIVALAP